MNQLPVNCPQFSHKIQILFYLPYTCPQMERLFFTGVVEIKVLIQVGNLCFVFNPYQARYFIWTCPSFNLDKTICHFEGIIQNLYLLNREHRDKIAQIFIAIHDVAAG
jgi:hypothetical protein